MPDSESQRGGHTPVVQPRRHRTRPTRLLRWLIHPLVCLGFALAGEQLLAGGGLWSGALLLLAAGALFAVSTLADRPAQPASVPDRGLAEDRPPPWGPGDGLTVLLILAVAAAFRLYAINQLPPGLAPDEARLGLAAANPFGGGPTGATWGGWPIVHWLTVASVAVLGHTPLAVRLPSVVAGILFAPALYLVGRQLGGRLLATTAGLLAAVTFWHADTTRGAWGYIAWGLALETLAISLLLRALRERQAAAAAFGGVALGLALQVSWGALAVPLAVGCWLLLRRGPRTSTPQLLNRAIAVPFAVYFLLAVGPILVGLTVPDRAAAAGLSEPSEEGAGGTIWAGARRALPMLHLAGDPSPLHNLDGAPMLDRFTGSLIVLGIGLALAHVRRPASGLLLVWLIAGYTPAVLASRNGGPDSLAALHVLPPALLLAGVALSSLGGRGFPGRTWRSRWHPDVVLVLLVVIAAVNGYTLFVRRTHDQATWTAYASAETLAAQALRPRAGANVVYLADAWLDHPTIRFLVPEVKDRRPVDPTGTVPFLADEPFIYVAPAAQDVVPDDLDRVYDDGNIDRFRSPLDDSVVARSFRASASDVAAARGVTLRVTTAERSRTARETLNAFSVDWPTAADAPRAVTLDLFSAVQAPAEGVYRFRLEAPPGSWLELNDAVLMRGGEEATALVARGSLRLRVVSPVDGSAHVELKWAPPGATDLMPIPANRLFREQRDSSGLLALYRPGADGDGPVAALQVERYLQRFDSPPRLPRPYMVEWLGTLDVPKTGVYRFALDASGPASLWIDDRPVALDVKNRDQIAVALLDEGDHAVRIEFVDAAAPTRFDLLWAAPDDDLEAIPTARFSPPIGPVPQHTPRRVDRPAVLAPLGEARVRWLASVDGEPRAVAVGPDGTVYLANSRQRQVQRVVDAGGEIVGLSGASLGTPSDVEVGADGRVWTIDAQRGQLVRFDPATGEAIVLGAKAELYRPRGLGLAADGTVYVADTGGNRIVHLAGDGSVLETIGPDIGGPERIRQPTDVAVSAGGELFVVNGEEGALLRLTADGRYIRQWQVLASDTERGSHLAIAPDGAVWVSEPDGRRISRFGQDGTPAGAVALTRGAGLLRTPVGVAVGADGTLYVGDVSLRAVLAIGTSPP